MATLADELLNDFEDSGSDRDNESHQNFSGDVAENGESGGARPSAHENGMDLDDDEELEDSEEEFNPENASTELRNAADEDEAKAKVEKLKLGGVSDVRSVAGLMKTLQPVLEVCAILSPAFSTYSEFTSFIKQS